MKKTVSENNNDIIKSCQSYTSVSNCLCCSKRVAKFSIKFKNHQNQLCRTVNIYDDIVMYKYSLKSFQHCVTLIYCLVKFIIYHQ